MWTQVPSWNAFLITLTLCFSTVCAGFMYSSLLLHHGPCVSSTCSVPICTVREGPAQESEYLRSKEHVKGWWLTLEEMLGSHSRGSFTQGRLGSRLILTSWSVSEGYGGSQGITSHPHLYKLLFSYLFPESLSRNLWLQVNVSFLAHKWIQLIF